MPSIAAVLAYEQRAELTRYVPEHDGPERTASSVADVHSDENMVMYHHGFFLLAAMGDDDDDDDVVLYAIGQFINRYAAPYRLSHAE
mmetsp:Transcript_28256/g.68046  ORF Transcript_28256/g.68046 Transcript_28256/m.68046 type:complete len:87 (+) Transcript_28256:1265-1525(+)